MLRDIWGQAWEAMVYNRRRTAITMIGMAWGIATVVLLLAYGAGFSHAIEAIFAAMGHEYHRHIPGPDQRTGGRRQGRGAGALHGGRRRSSDNSVPGIVHISPQVQKDVTGAERSAHLHVDGEWRKNGVPGHLEAGHGSRGDSSTGQRISSGPMCA